MGYNHQRVTQADSDHPNTGSTVTFWGDNPGNERGLYFMSNTRVFAADLGPTVAAFTCYIQGQPAAVVNTAAAADPEMRAQAVWSLKRVGIDADQIHGALNGVRS